MCQSRIHTRLAGFQSRASSPSLNVVPAARPIDRAELRCCADIGVLTIHITIAIASRMRVRGTIFTRMSND